MLTKEQNRERMRAVRAAAKMRREAAGADAIQAARLAVRRVRMYLRDAPPEYTEAMRAQLKDAEARCRALGVRPPRTRDQIKAQTAKQKAARTATASLAAELAATRLRLRTAQRNLKGLTQGTAAYRRQRRSVMLNAHRLERLGNLAALATASPRAAWVYESGTYERVQDVRCCRCVRLVKRGGARHASTTGGDGNAGARHAFTL